MVTRRDCSAITKKTRYRGSPASVSTSTVNRSQAVRPSQGACRNVFQGMRRLRSGAGSIPWSCRIRFTVVGAISWPRCESAPRIRVYPHWGCSTAIWTTRAATSRRVIGRPRPRRARPSYVWAINLRYQRENRVRRDDAGDLHHDAPSELLAAHGWFRGVGHRSGEAAEGPGAPGGPDSPPGDTRSDRLGGGSPSQRT